MKKLGICLGMVLGIAMLLHGEELTREVMPLDGLDCSFDGGDLHMGGTPLGGGVNVVSSGYVESFGCLTKQGKRKLIGLESKSIRWGRLETKAFGVIDVGLDRNANTRFFMSDNQIKKLRTFLGF